jgi:FYVE zinc finger
MQTLDDYVSDLIDVNSTPTPGRILVLSRALIDLFTALTAQSENRIIEHGANLFWRNDRIIPGGIITGQSKTAVDMDTKNMFRNHEYVGDCHTHPYLKKMGPEAMVGPSSGDYMEWWLNHPANFPFSLHFVLSGDAVFLLLTRDVTRLGDKPLGVAQRTVAPDTAIINEPMHDLDTSEVYSKAQAANKERDFWKINFPNIPREFAQANLDMNIGLATALSFEYYRGKFNGDGIILERQSPEEVYGPAAIVGKTLRPLPTATWISDSRASRCTSCKRSFSMTFRKHHCRNCGLIFCDQCTIHTAPVRNRLSRWGGNIDGVKVARVCDKCYSMCR